MSPEHKRRLAFLSVALLVVALCFFILSYIPTYLYILFFFLGSCGVCYYKAEEFQLFDRLGLNPRRGLTVPAALLRWLPGRTLRGAPAAGRNKTRTNKSDVRNSLTSSSDRQFAGSVYRRDASFSDAVFSPRDLLMGSYLVKPESPSGAGRPGGGPGAAHLHPREPLRERLARPNHAVPTPNRRLSFGDPAGRFTVTPQRHYPLQQMGTSSVGVLPPAQWDGFRKKSVLTQRNTPVHSPVTVKIARPDSTTRSSFFPQPNSPGVLVSPGFGVQADPCSRETVLSVLRESRKREVDDEDKDRASGQKIKRRRRHNSSESSQSVLEPMLVNGAPSQLEHKPGSLKRGTNASVLEECTMKRSRTSSISSVSGGPASCGVPGSARNPIRSSYSSSQGCTQRRGASGLNLSPFASPGSSRCQTPERVAKKPREEDATSPSSASSVKSDKVAAVLTPGSGNCTPTHEALVPSPSDSGGDSSKRRRKIPLVTTRRGDQISLPPPPELGYTITVKDLDMEKKAVLNQIHKVLKEPEPEKSAPAPVLASVSAPVPAPGLGLASVSTLVPAPGLGLASVSTLVPAPGLGLASVSTLVPAPAPCLASVSAPVPALAPGLTSVSAPVPAPGLSSASAPAPALTSAPAPGATLSLGLFSLAPASSTSITPVTAAPALASPSPPSVGPAPSSTAASTPAPAHTIDLTVTPTSTTSNALAPPGAGPSLGRPSPLQHFLQNMSSSSLLATAAAPAALSAVPPGAVPPGVVLPGAVPPPASSAAGTSAMKPEPTLSALQPPGPPATSAPSAFAQILAQPLQPSGVFGVGGGSLVPASTPASAAPTPAATSASTTPAHGSAHFLPSGFKPIFGASTSAADLKPSFKPIFGSAFGQPVTTVSSTPATNNGSQMFGSLSTTQPPTTSVPSSAIPAQTPGQPAFSSWGAAPTAPGPSLGPSPAPGGTFQFRAPSSASAASTSGATGNSLTASFKFGAVKAAQTAAPAASQGAFAFGQVPAAQNSAASPFGGFGVAGSVSTTTANAPTTQAAFGSSAFGASASFPGAAAQAPASAKPFTFGSGNSALTPFTFGAPASTAAPAFGTTAPPALGGAATGFSFGNVPAQPVAPAFGAPTRAPASVPAPAFAFGAAQANPQNSNQGASAPPPSGGFSFTASLSGSPAPVAQTPGFPFGAANTDIKPAFGTSTPAFGTAGGPLAFGSPGTPVQGFGAASFATPSATFSIGAGSKPGGARQRLQARRQHVRKK